MVLDRVKVLQQMFPEHLDAILLSDPFSMRYYTGFTGGEGYVLVKRQGLPVVFTDFRYTEMVSKECANADCIEIKGGKKALEKIYEVVKLCGVAVLGIEEEHLNVSTFEKLQQTFADISWASCSEMVGKPREIKDEQEITCIAKAEAIGDAAFAHVLSIIKAGITEQEIALELEFFMRKQGATGLSFDTIVASGENSSMPHAGVSSRVLQNGDLVTMDFGCIYEGYCSDMTRTIGVGELSEDKCKVYHTVLEAQKLALETIKPGVKCSDIDKIARDYIYEAGYEGCFGHSLGHSVGLYIHEEPRFAGSCDTILRPGMVLTVEPGIYLAGQYGVRIEDVVVITEDGYQNLTASPKNLICV